MTKIVYVGMCADLIHHGHLNIIEHARAHGEVVVGLLTDEAVASYKRVPALKFEHRKKVVENIKGVSRVIPQETLSYVDNLKMLKPDFVVHGSDWKSGPQKKARREVIDTLALWGGSLIEVEYTPEISSTKLHRHLKSLGVTPSERMRKLRSQLEQKQIVRILETHNGLTGLIAENTEVIRANARREFDGMWLSSLTHSTSKGKPDIQYVDITSVSNTLSEIFEVTTKPMIVDADSGGLTEHFKFTVKTLERLGVSAVIIEDKTGSKRNSLFGTSRRQKQDTVENFCFKISEGKRSQVTEDFMIIARVESLILGQGMDDALSRSFSYIEAGADGIMIHSKEQDPSEILEFCKHFRAKDTITPLVVVPSTYNKITESELIRSGVNVVIYANHLLRSAYPAMRSVAQSILENERSWECNDACLPIKEILTLIPGAE